MLRLRPVYLVLAIVMATAAAGYFAYRVLAQQPNRPPVAVPDSITVHGYVVTPSGANALWNDSDPDGDNLTVTYTTNTTTPYGVGNVHWTGGIGFSGGPNPGTATIPYTVIDNRGGSASSHVTVNVVNSAPTAGWDLVVVPGVNNANEALNVLDNDSDPDGDPVQTGYIGNTALPGSGGAAQYNIYNNLITVSRYQWYSGTSVVFYQVTDSLGASSSGAIVVVFLPIDGANNAGAFCPSQGDPVNPTNGNMWIDQPADYVLPGRGEFITVKRFYNSAIQTSGLFGLGWSTQYDESVTTYGDKLLRLNMSDGRAQYFVRQNTSDPFVAYQSEVQGQIVKNADNSYTFSTKDGRVHDFSSAGKLTRQTDWNGNQTTLAYDASNRLTSVTDPAGRVLTVTPNTNGTVSQISDAIGSVASYEYFTGTTRLKTVTYPDGSKYKFEYDTTSASGKVLLKTVKDAYDNILETHLYDSSGRATTSERHGGVQKYEFDYANASGSNPYTIVKHRKNAADPYITTKYFFNNRRARNYITKTEGLCGCGGSGSEITEFQYDVDLKLKKKIDAEGRTTEYFYDANRNLTQVVDPLGTQKWTYNGRGQVLTYKDRVHQSTSSNTIANTFDANGNLLTTTDALGNVVTLTYTSAGQPASVTDARANSTLFSYDTQSRLVEVTDANNKDTTFGYDTRARLTSTTNALSETTTFEYDLNNRLKKVIFPDTNYLEHTFDLAGRRTATRDPRGNSTTYVYDNAYRLTIVTDPLSHSRTFAYDLMSNLTSQTDALGNTTNFEYDDFNRLKKAIYPPASTGITRLEESTTYDKLGNVKTRVDTAGRTTSYDYDTSNRLTKITDALTNQTQFEYNLRSQLTKVKDALNQEYVFTYDPLGRTLSQTRAGTTMSYEYDAVGNRTKRTDYNGSVTNYTYDNLNRLTSGSLGTYTYDDLSRMLTAVNSNGTVSFTYDNRGRVDTTTDVYGKVLDYDYDANGNRTLMKLDGVSHTGYAYDAANRLSTITNVPESAITNYGYDIADRFISNAFPNGVTRTLEYDGMSRLTRLKDQSTSALHDRQYTYNAANQIASITESNRTRSFTYDNVDRLIAATDTYFGNESYTYDAVGNRTSSHLSPTYTHNPFNRLTATSSVSFTYDNNGAMTSRTDSSGTLYFSHDSDGRLANAYSYTGPWGFEMAEFYYDALGRRILKNEPNDLPREYTYDGDNVLISSWGGMPTKYVNGPGIDNPLSMKLAGSSTWSYPLTDHLGTQGATDSFGNGGYNFTGREYDSYTQLYYYRARMYDPQLGRFVSEDPIGFQGGDINLYGYVKNKPTNRRDPMGLDDADRIFYESLSSGWDQLPLSPAEAARIERTSSCYRRNKFSAVFSFGNSDAENALEYVEVGSLSSLALDGVAMRRKYLGPKTASPNPYASGINMVTKDVNRSLGFPRIAGSPLGKYLSPIGTRLSPILAVTGAGTLAYNVTTDIQCLCGVIE